MMLYLWTKMDIVLGTEAGFFIKTEGLSQNNKVYYSLATTDIYDDHLKCKVYDDGKELILIIQLNFEW